MTGAEFCSAYTELGVKVTVVASRDLRQALQVVARYGAVRHRALLYELQDVAGGGLVLRVADRLPAGEARRFVLDTLFGACLRLMETVAGPNLPGLRVELRSGVFLQNVGEGQYVAQICPQIVRHGVAELL